MNKTKFKQISIILFFIVLLLGFGKEGFAEGEKCWNYNPTTRIWENQKLTLNQCIDTFDIFSVAQPTDVPTLVFGKNTYTFDGKKTYTFDGEPKDITIWKNQDQTLSDDSQVILDGLYHSGQKDKDNLNKVTETYDPLTQGSAHKILAGEEDSLTNPAAESAKVETPEKESNKKDTDIPELSTPIWIKGDLTINTLEKKDNEKRSVLLGVDKDRNIYCTVTQNEKKSFEKCGFVVTDGVILDRTKGLAGKYVYGCDRSGENCKTASPNQFFTGPSGKHYTLEDSKVESKCEILDAKFQAQEEPSSGYCGAAYFSQSLTNALSGFEQYTAFDWAYSDSDSAKKYQQWLLNTNWGWVVGLGSQEVFTSKVCGLDSKFKHSNGVARDDATGAVGLSYNRDGYMSPQAASSKVVEVSQNEKGNPTQTNWYVNKISFSVQASSVNCEDNMAFNVFYGIDKDAIAFSEEVSYNENWDRLVDDSARKYPLYKGSSSGARVDKNIPPGGIDSHAGLSLFVMKSKNDYSGKYICIEVEQNNNCFGTETHPAICNLIVNGTETPDDINALYSCPTTGGMCTLKPANGLNPLPSSPAGTSVQGDSATLAGGCIDC